ncbi:unnamed protein product [Brassicogethes aeneus]|uniref:Uncharacterized protein n=1 Tax=Brassicogethes aeneus TaxID=1431903 RepID=A0A9P0B2W2_BRAAE|nr:unnamed protein product [Brassicogethes aeneus]
MAIQKLAKGDRKLKIPSLLPLRIPIVELNTGESFMLKIKNIKLYGLDKLKPIKFQTNFKKKTGMTLSHVEKVVILGNYDMKGKISVLPVEGQGPLNLTLGTYDL